MYNMSDVQQNIRVWARRFDVSVPPTPKQVQAGIGVTVFSISVAIRAALNQRNRLPAEHRAVVAHCAAKYIKLQMDGMHSLTTSGTLDIVRRDLIQCHPAPEEAAKILAAHREVVVDLAMEGLTARRNEYARPSITNAILAKARRVHQATP